MNRILSLQFNELLSRQDIDTIITSQNCFKVSSIITTKIYKHVLSTYFDTHYFLIISKLFSDSLDAMHDDSRELLQLKYKDKYENFQSKTSIELYLHEVQILCQTEKAESSTPETSPDIFTTDDEEEVKPKKTFKDIKNEIIKPTKKKSSNKSSKSDEETIVKSIKEKRQVEEYEAVQFNDDDNNKIDAIFFD